MRKSSLSRSVQMDQHKLVQVRAKLRKKKGDPHKLVTDAVLAMKSLMIKLANMAL